MKHSVVLLKMVCQNSQRERERERERERLIGNTPFNVSFLRHTKLPCRVGKKKKKEKKDEKEINRIKLL